MSLYNQRDIQRWSTNGRAATRLAAKSTGFAIIADRPSHIEKQGGLAGAEQVLATILIVVMLILTGISWSLAPALGGAMAILGTYFVARRVAAFASTPVRLRTFFRLVGSVPAWYIVSSLSLIVFAALYRSVVIPWIPVWMRDGGYTAASVAIIVNFAVSIWLGTRAVKNYRAALADQAEVQSSIATMLGANPRALFEPSPLSGIQAADWTYGRNDSIIVNPQPDVDLLGVSDRLARTRLGQRYEVADADYERVILVPISEETLERQRQRAASGGLIEGSDDLTGVPTENSVTTFAADDDDPFGALDSTPAAPAAGAAGGIPTFDEKDWT